MIQSDVHLSERGRSDQANGMRCEDDDPEEAWTSSASYMVKESFRFISSDSIFAMMCLVKPGVKNWLELRTFASEPEVNICRVSKLQTQSRAKSTIADAKSPNLQLYEQDSQGTLGYTDMRLQNRPRRHGGSEDATSLLQVDFNQRM